MAQAYQSYKTTADSNGTWRDSVISVTKQITAIDKQSKIAYTLQYEAYKAKNDTVNTLPALLAIMNADPTNTTLREQVISEVVNSGKANLAIPMAKQLVADNPGDPQYARTYWLVLRAARNFKESVPAGIAYAALDSAVADSNYYFRQVQDLAADSAFAKAAEFAATGAAKYPRSASLLLMKAQNERRAGQLPAAKATLQRALQVDPKVSGANLLLAQISADIGAGADAIKAVQADVAADPTNKERDAQFLLGLGNTAYRAANTSKKAEDFKKALTFLQASDAMNATPNAKFLVAVSAFSLLQQSAAELQKSKTCNDAKESAEYLALVNTYMPAGGSVSPDAAKQILGAVGQYQAFVDASVKRYCK